MTWEIIIQVSKIIFSINFKTSKDTKRLKNIIIYSLLFNKNLNICVTYLKIGIQSLHKKMNESMLRAFEDHPKA